MRRVRLLLLLACAGMVAGAAGHLLTGAQAWYLALPAALAAGWLFVADPTHCTPPPPPSPLLPSSPPTRSATLPQVDHLQQEPGKARRL
jgi:hypothetical protein